jgi:hypothetical protein
MVRFSYLWIQKVFVSLDPKDFRIFRVLIHKGFRIFWIQKSFRIFGPEKFSYLSGSHPKRFSYLLDLKGFRICHVYVSRE